MFGRSLIFLLLACLVSAEIPSYIKVCGRRNQELDKCVQESVEALRDKLRTGMPELAVPPLEPLYLSGFPLSETETFKAYASNVTLRGLSNFELQSFHVDFENMQFTTAVNFKKIILDADYDINAKIVVPIKGKGPIHIESDDIESSVVMKYKLIKRNGGEYMFYYTMTTHLNIRDYTAVFKPSDGENSPLSMAINSALEGGRREILELIRPTLERVVSERILELANQICKNFTMDELYPDRE